MHYPPPLHRIEFANPFISPSEVGFRLPPPQTPLTTNGPIVHVLPGSMHRPHPCPHLPAHFLSLACSVSRVVYFPSRAAPAGASDPGMRPRPQQPRRRPWQPNVAPGHGGTLLARRVDGSIHPKPLPFVIRPLSRTPQG